MCERSRDEPERFAKYPRIPVLACPGFERRSSARGSLPREGS
jgi:hypothetical protein